MCSLDEILFALALPMLDLLFGQRQEITIVSTIGLSRILGEGTVVAQKRWQSQLFEVGIEQGRDFHQRPPCCSNWL